MRTVNEEARRAKEIEIMETCFDCYAENGFTSVGVKTIAKACDCSVATLYQYFDNLDDLIVKSTEYCMSKNPVGSSPYRNFTAASFLLPPDKSKTTQSVFLRS